MSINSAMLAGVSGLMANSSSLAAISDNIANVNTVGYKRSAATFSSMVTSQARGTGYSAGGVKALTQRYVSAEGLHMRAASTDISISGQGFFIGTDVAEGALPTDTRTFTRAGQMFVSKDGYLQTASGLYLQGWEADSVTGEIAVDPSDISKLKAINVSGSGGTAEATNRVRVNANLDAKQVSTTYTTAPGYAAGDMAAYNATDGASGLRPDFEINVPISDSKGGQRNITIGFMKTDNPNEWVAEIYADPSELDPSSPNGQISQGIVQFDNKGKLLNTGTLLNGNPPTISIGASDSADAVRWATDLGIAGQTIQIDLGGAAGGITQANAKSLTQSINTNGTPFGVLTDLELDESGYVTAIYDNGVTRRISQIAIATFENADELLAVTGTGYRVSEKSGGYTLKSPGTGGAGTIDPGTLEASTVDLSTEFTGLITTQRAYSAAAKIITTADQMLDDLINIKR